MNDKTKNLVRGSIDVLPLLIPVVPFGIIFGAIGIELGFGPYVTYATSIIIFSGASQIVFFQLLSAGASSIVAITSSSVISTRHLLYGVVVNQYLSNLSICSSRSHRRHFPSQTPVLTHYSTIPLFTR